MSSRFIYIILFAATLAVTVMAAVWLPADFHPAVIVAGVVLLALEVWLYVALVRPVRTLANGIGLIRAQDFSSRLARVGQIDADRLVETFNRMMDVLKSERLRLNERNNFLQLLIDASPAAIVVGDFDGRVTDCNPAAVALFGALPPGATLASLPGDLWRRLRLASPRSFGHGASVEHGNLPVQLAVVHGVGFLASVPACGERDRGGTPGRAAGRPPHSAGHGA